MGTAAGAAGSVGWGLPMAGKTGTTESHRSSAFLGYTNQLAAASYVFDDSPKPAALVRVPAAQVRREAETSTAEPRPAQTWFLAMSPMATNFRPGDAAADRSALRQRRPAGRRPGRRGTEVRRCQEAHRGRRIPGGRPADAGEQHGDQRLGRRHHARPVRCSPARSSRSTPAPVTSRPPPPVYIPPPPVYNPTYNTDYNNDYNRRPGRATTSRRTTAGSTRRPRHRHRRPRRRPPPADVNIIRSRVCRRSQFRPRRRRRPPPDPIPPPPPAPEFSRRHHRRRHRVPPAAATAAGTGVLPPPRHLRPKRLRRRRRSGSRCGPPATPAAGSSAPPGRCRAGRSTASAPGAPTRPGTGRPARWARTPPPRRTGFRSPNPSGAAAAGRTAAAGRRVRPGCCGPATPSARLRAETAAGRWRRRRRWRTRRGDRAPAVPG